MVKISDDAIPFGNEDISNFIIGDETDCKYYGYTKNKFVSHYPSIMINHREPSFTFIEFVEITVIYELGNTFSLPIYYSVFFKDSEVLFQYTRKNILFSVLCFCKKILGVNLEENTK